jgi:phosphatidate cytidylyltransferase
MSNTQKRVLSAIVMVASLSIFFWLGKDFVLSLLLLIGMVMVDEIYTNFFARKRGELNYFLAHACLALPFAHLFFIERSHDLVRMMINGAVALNFLLIIYLFTVRLESTRMISFARRFPVLSGLFILLPLCALGGMMYESNWMRILILLMVVNFGMDTGAWFFGRSFGKHKLWPAVSPKKTIEGLVGGMLFSAVVGGITSHLLLGKMGLTHFLFFMLLGLLAQMGDLVQSKLKRQFGIKDSSALIPGHGGVYDRMDSLIFLAPFFAITMDFIYY